MKIDSHVEKYGFCPIIESDKRKTRIALLTEKVHLQEQLVDQMTTKELIAYKTDLEHLSQLSRIDRAEEDVLYFAYEYFSFDRNSDYGDNVIPKGITIEDAPDFHIELSNVLNVVSNEQINKRIAWASPRGSAKSVYLSNIFPLHQIVFQKRKYILVISETDSISKKFMEYIANALKFNQKLREDFGELLSPKKQENTLDNLEMVLTKSGTLIESASIGKQLRGKRNGAYRPDLVILDDLESAKNTNTPELREKNVHWFNSVVIPIGEPDRTAFVYIGTAVHKDGLLFEVMKRADFESKLFSAIVSYPTNEELWDEFEEIIRDSSIENRMEVANKFYQENKEAMDEGVEVLWESRWSYKDLMIEKANMTSRAFSSEFLNNPYDVSSQTFDTSQFKYFDKAELDELDRQDRLEYFGAWDIAYGQSKRSDYNAIVIIGRDIVTGTLYVVETYAKKCQAHVAMEMACKLIEEYRPVKFAVETVGGQVDFFRQLNLMLVKKKLYHTKLIGYKPNRGSGSKVQRIESLEPLITNGNIRFRYSQKLMLEQLEAFPQGSHDDLPDALFQVVNTIGINGRRKSWSTKPIGF